MDDEKWGYGSGMIGCLFDNGPEVADSKDVAIDSVLFPFEDIEDLPDEILSEARNSLEENEIYYFPANVQSIAGAQVLQIWAAGTSNADEEEETTLKGFPCDCHKTVGPGLHESWCRIDKLLKGD